MPKHTVALVVLIASLFVMNVALMARPCEIYRARVVWAEAAFTARNTVSAWDAERGACVCMTVDSDDPWVISEGLEARRRSEDHEIIPKVEF